MTDTVLTTHPATCIAAQMVNRPMLLNSMNMELAQGFYDVLAGTGLSVCLDIRNPVEESGTGSQKGMPQWI